MISLQSYIIRNKEMLWRTVEEEVFIINADGQNIHVLNKTASYIWELAEKKIPICDIVKSIYDRFDIDEETARADTVELVSQMLNKNIIALSDKPLEG